MKKIVVAIDGFSSCGKSTMAKTLARETSYIYVDTGAMYRAIGLFCWRQGWINDTEIHLDQIVENVDRIDVKFEFQAPGVAEIYLNGENVEKEIRSLAMANVASRISTIPEVRTALVKQQQKMGEEKGIVMDGRDIGTVVFPDAELKIFLTASPEVRAKRRFDELVAKGEKLDFAAVLANVVERDERDQNRAESPLRKAEDAVVIDNSNLTPAEQQQILRELFVARLDSL